MNLFLIFLFITGAPEDKLTFRLPSLSPDADKVVFSCMGDLWMVPLEGGRAKRLTVSEGYESSSLWSPDGQWIVFVSSRWGNGDLYLLPVSESTPPKRLTYYSGYDGMLDWHPDSKKIYFWSARNNPLGEVYTISIDGGNPELFLDFDLNSMKLMDGDSILYTRGNTSWLRKKYRGPANRDIWKKKLPDGESRRLTDFEGRDAAPMYSEKTGLVYFISNRGNKNINNIWKMKPDGTSPQKVTDFDEEVLLPKISADGSTIAFTKMGKIYLLDVVTEEVEKLTVKLPLDYKQPPLTFKTFTGEVSEFAVSPDEDEIAFVVHGDILVARMKEDGSLDELKQITDHPAVDKNVNWHPEEEKIVFSSLRDGDYDLYTIQPEEEENFYDEMSFKTVKLFDTPITEKKPMYSPDGEKIAFLQSTGHLSVAKHDGGDIKKVTSVGDILWVDWSPDSRWLAYSRTKLGWREDVYVLNLDNMEEKFNLSDHPNDDYKPMWSSDGRRIAYASRDNVGNLWLKYVFLRKEDSEKDREYWKENIDSVPPLDKIEIDFEDINERIHEITKVRGGYNKFTQSPRGKVFAVHSENLNSDDIWSIDIFGEELTRLTRGDIDPEQMYITKDAKKVIYLTGNGSLGSVAIENPQQTHLSFAKEIKIDRFKERAETFLQAWWVLKDGFYDSDFHGVNWEKMYEKYRELAVNSRELYTFHFVVEMMLGELNASHLGIWKYDASGDNTGRIGVIPDYTYKGNGLRVKEVIPESPAEEKDIEPGDIITSIEGKEIKRKNFFSFLRRAANREIFIQVNGKKVEIKPVSVWSIRRLLEKYWVKRNREWVKENSQGRIGYVYISSMGDWNLKKFEEDLYKVRDKEGLILDVRYNGGGHIHDELLTILRRTIYGFSKERGDPDTTYSSALRWSKPIVLLINEHCFSDAEIFPMGFKQLQLGTVVGQPTFGGVIGTSNLQLMDGSTFREPSTGWYRLTGKNLENNPVEPDIYVENPPEQDGDVPDNQLRKALRLLMK